MRPGAHTLRGAARTAPGHKGHFNPMGTGQQVVIVGGGIAGVSAATAARREYPTATVILLGAEAEGFYNRIALSALATGRKDPATMAFYPSDWLARQEIETRFGAVVEGIDRSGGKVRVSGAPSVDYDRLILATGAAPVLPPVEGIASEEVHTIWTIEDARRLKPKIARARRAVVIGGGVLGVEAAVDLRREAKQVTLVETRDGILPSHLDSGAARFYRRQLEKLGIEILVGVTVARISEDNDGVLLALGDGRRLRGDVVLCQTGVRPNVALARDAGLQIDGGIVVDQSLVTADPRILACGNCASVDGSVSLLWNPARHQGEVAGVNAFATKLTASTGPVPLHVKTPEVPLFVVGDPVAQAGFGRVLQDEGEDWYRSVFLTEAKTLGSAILIGDTAGFYEMSAILDRGGALPEAAAEARDMNGFLDAIRAHDDGDGVSRRAWVCRMCGFTHEGHMPPESCPVCSVGKDQFAVT